MSDPQLCRSVLRAGQHQGEAYQPRCGRAAEEEGRIIVAREEEERGASK